MTFVGGIGGVLVGDYAVFPGGTLAPATLGYNVDSAEQQPIIIRAIGGDVSVTPTFLDGEYRAAWIGPNVTIESIGGDVGEVSCSLLYEGARIIAEDGRIGLLSVYPQPDDTSGGGEPIVLRAQSIGTIEGLAFVLDCVVGDGVSAAGTIDRMAVGHLDGVVNAGQIDEFTVYGDCPATVRVRAAAPGKVFRVGGSLAVTPPPSLAPDHGGKFILTGNSGNAETFVILNAFNNGGTWQARDGVFASVDVLTSSGTISLAPAPTAQPNRAPYYDRTPAELGGIGAGLAPFHLHAAACSPPSNPTIPVFLNSAFGHVTPAFPGAYEFVEIEKVFYGPIRTASITQHPVTITRDVPGSPQPPIEGYTVTLKRGDEPGLSRVMTIHGNGSLLLPGTYTIRPKRDTELHEVLRCDGLLTTAIVPVADFEYTFVLAGDCNLNGEEDLAEIDAQPGKDQWPINDIIDACEDCFADLNCDWAEDGFDVETMSLAVDGDFTDFCGIDPDFNHDLTLDGFDVLAVETAVGGGPCP